MDLLPLFIIVIIVAILIGTAMAVLIWRLGRDPAALPPADNIAETLSYQEVRARYLASDPAIMKAAGVTNLDAVAELKPGPLRVLLKLSKFLQRQYTNVAPRTLSNLSILAEIKQRIADGSATTVDQSYYAEVINHLASGIEYEIGLAAFGPPRLEPVKKWADLPAATTPAQKEIEAMILAARMVK